MTCFKLYFEDILHISNKSPIAVSAYCIIYGSEPKFEDLCLIS